MPDDGNSTGQRLATLELAEAVAVGWSASALRTLTIARCCTMPGATTM
jgi:hypothetical protein